MINLEKIKLEKGHPPSPFKKTCPCAILSPPFFNFSNSPHLGKVIKTYSRPLKKGGLNNVSLHTSCFISVIIKKAFSVVSSGLEFDFHPFWLLYNYYIV